MNVKDKVVNDLIKKWGDRLMLGNWRITWNQVSMSLLGRNYIEPEYFRSYIDLDIQRHKNLDDLENTIRHELIHLLHGHFTESFQLVKMAVDEKNKEILEESFVHACEKFTHDLEDILDDFDWNDD